MDSSGEEKTFKSFNKIHPVSVDKTDSAYCKKRCSSGSLKDEKVYEITGFVKWLNVLLCR